MSSDGESGQKLRGASMVAAYEEILKSPRWEKNDGVDFVFYDSHSGFGLHEAGIPLDDFICRNFRNSTILTTVRPLAFLGHSTECFCRPGLAALLLCKNPVHPAYHLFVCNFKLVRSLNLMPDAVQDRTFRAMTCEKQLLPALSPNRVMIVPYVSPPSAL